MIRIKCRKLQKINLSYFHM